ncbi:cytochrome P450 [Streptomyces sp. NPDC087270]|uniref:cytochrome P450 n=1 Tax=Streptomyces sp. NPDC087270 TaxID=3365774 RepID=UPI0038147B39
MSTGSTARAFDLTDPATFAGDAQHSFWREARRTSPVYWHEGADGRPGFWVVASHADVQGCYNSPKTLSSARGTVLDVLLRGDDSAGGRMLAVTDRPRHRQLRNLMLRAFSPRMLSDVAERVRSRTAALVAEVAGPGTFDFATEVADHLPIQTICDLLAIPWEDRGQLLEWNKRTLSSATAEPDELDALSARNEIVLYFMDLAARRRVRPDSDVVSMLATAEVEGARLPLEDIALNCYSLILGGDESSRMAAISAVHALALHPGQWRDLREGRIPLDTAVEELLRWATPALHFARTAAVDTVIGGQRIRARDIVTLWNVSANNDEDVFDSPRTLNLSRTPNQHIAFGRGPHFCLGAFLGRVSLHALLAALATTVEKVELTGPPVPVYSTFLQGYRSLPVHLARGHAGPSAAAVSRRVG